MPSRGKRHVPYTPPARRHCPPTESRQARRALATNSAEWRAIRAEHLAMEPDCRLCAQRSVRRQANHVDHIDGNDSDSGHGNLQSLCGPCHSRKTAIQDGSFGNVSILPAWIPKPSKPLIVVCGPPSAGKTTYVAQHADPKDMVLDLDETADQMTGTPLYALPKNALVNLIRNRNQRLADFAKGRTSHPRCWLIATSGTFKQRRFWEDKGATVTVVNPGSATCRDRTLASAVYPEDEKARRIKAIDKWS